MRHVGYAILTNSCFLHSPKDISSWSRAVVLAKEIYVWVQQGVCAVRLWLVVSAFFLKATKEL